jgi:hypothetical protein
MKGATFLETYSWHNVLWQSSTPGILGDAGCLCIHSEGSILVEVSEREEVTWNREGVTFRLEDRFGHIDTSMGTGA